MTSGSPSLVGEEIFTCRLERDVVVIEVRGPWNAAACPLFGAIGTALVRRGYGRVVLDLADAPSLDASAFGRLLELQDLLSPDRHPVVCLASPQEAVRRSLEASHLDEVLPVFPDVAEAVAFLGR